MNTVNLLNQTLNCNIQNECVIPCNDGSDTSVYESMRFYCNDCSHHDEQCPLEVAPYCQTKYYNDVCCRWGLNYTDGNIHLTTNTIATETLEQIFGKLCCSVSPLPVTVQRRLMHNSNCLKSADATPPDWWNDEWNVLHQVNPSKYTSPTVCSTLLGSRFDWKITHVEYNDFKPSPTPVQAYRCCIDGVDANGEPIPLLDDEWTSLVLGLHDTHIGYGCSHTCADFFEDAYYSEAIDMRSVCGDAYEISRSYFLKEANCNE